MKRIVAALVPLAVMLAPACNRNGSATLPVSTAPVLRRDIVIDAQANGVVEPINVVEVKSKASGLITRMPVETGSNVRAGDLIVQVDQRDVRNQYNQAEADLRAADARLEVSLAQKRRSDEMFRQRVITAQEHETAALDYANAQAAVIRARANLDLAQQRLEDATVTAPVAGTVIEKAVSQGMVITSATGAFGGGTMLVKMADLSRVRMRAQFNETDIGQVRAGQPAVVIVDAYPDRRFGGIVEKIEPQAVVQQGVTMFPVLVTLDNLDGALKPGMNGEVQVQIDRRLGVLAVPNDAIKNVREAMATAPLLGLSPDSVQARIRGQFGGGSGGLPGGGAGGSGSATGSGQPAALRRRAVTSSPGDVALQSTQGPRVRAQMPGVSEPETRGSAPAREQLRIASPERGRGAAVRSGVVFVGRDGKFEPRMVMLGAGNFDYTEVIGGLQEGDEVAMLAALSLQAQRQQQTERFRQNIGGGVPGMTQGGGPGGPGGAGRGGGGGGGGGGPR